MRDGNFRDSLTFLGLCGIAEYFFADDTIGGFQKILLERFLDIAEFRPERRLNEAGGSFDHYGGVALAAVAIGVESITAAEGAEEAAGPLVGESELEFNGFFDAFGFLEAFADPVHGGSSGNALAGRGGAGVERFNAAEFMAKFLFKGHSGES